MALNLQNKYTGRFDPVSADYPQGKFKNRSSPTSNDGSYMERDWLNDWAGFFGALLNNAGSVPNGVVDTAQSSQLYDALQVLSYPVGAPIPWPTNVPPVGFIAMAGQSFSAATYPKLAQAYPSLVLPDLRGEFIRGWDNGRGIDVGRSMLSYQQDQQQPITGRIWNPGGAYQFLGETVSAEGAFATNGNNKSGSIPDAAGLSGPSELTFDSARVARTGSENRPRNITFNYIVRAA